MGGLVTERQSDVDEQTIADAYRRLTAPSATSVDIVERIHDRISRRRRFRIWGGVTIALAVIATIAAVGWTVLPRPVEPRTTSPGSSTSATPRPTRSGPVDSEAATSCAYAYNSRTLADRDWAVDATVTRLSIHGTEAWVRLDVHHWYRGGSGSPVSVSMPAPLDQEDAPPSYDVGTRLLISGDRDGAYLGWSCGFTRYYDQRTAASWKRVFG